MTGRAAALQGGLAALGLLTAHLTWQREPERAPGEVAIFDAGKKDVTRIHYEDDNNTVDLAPVPGADEPTVMIHLVEKSKAAPPANPHDKTPPPPPGPTPPPRDLLGGEGAPKLYEKFTPFMSPRGFGVVEPAKLKEIGLDNPKRKLTVTVKGDNRQYEIGSPSSSSGGEAFIRDVRDGRVYLMPRGVLSELQNAAHMVDRKLHTFEMADYDRLVVTAGGKKKEFVHVGKENFGTEGFATAKSPDKRDQMAKNWHDTLWRTFPMDVLGKGETPPEGVPKTVVRVDYLNGKKQVGWTELARAESAGKTTSEDATPSGDIYARTEHTVGWTKLHSGGQLVTDAEKLAAAP